MTREPAPQARIMGRPAKSAPCDSSEGLAAAEAAAVAILAKGRTVKWAALARVHGVKADCLRKRAMARHKGKPLAARKGPAPQLSTHVEDRLAAWVGQLHALGQAVTQLSLRTKAAQLASKSKTPFVRGLPSMKWARSFRKRYNLALRKPTPLSKQRRLDAAMLRELKQYFRVHLLPAMQMQWGGKDSSTFLQTPWRIINLDERGWGGVRAGTAAG